VLEFLGILCNQAERTFQDDNNTPTNQQMKQELDQQKFTLVVTSMALGILGCNELLEISFAINNLVLHV
jgi:hypothetical protein